MFAIHIGLFEGGQAVGVWIRPNPRPVRDVSVINDVSIEGSKCCKARFLVSLALKVSKACWCSGSYCHCSPAFKRGSRGEIKSERLGEKDCSWLHRPINDPSWVRLSGEGKSKIPCNLWPWGKTLLALITCPAKSTVVPTSNFFCERMKLCLRQRSKRAVILSVRMSMVGADMRMSSTSFWTPGRFATWEKKTWETAKSMFFWPGLKEQIKQRMQKCEQCQKFRLSQPAEPLIQTTAGFPMHKVSTDPYKANGINYLIVADRFSGYPFIATLKDTSTSVIIKHMTSWFQTYGIPLAIRTDGGPQFRGPFKDFCKSMGIIHEQSFGYCPQSNGHAKAAVKNVKHLILKVPPSSFPAAFSAWKNTARSNKPSSNTLFFGPNVRLDLPITLDHLKTPPSLLSPASFPNKATGRLPRPLSPNTKVWIQCPHTKRWPTKGIITSVSNTGLTYVVRLEFGEEIRRNRIFLRPCYV